MGKGSNASKIARARADAAKRKASEGKGGGGKAGLMARKGALNTSEAIEKAKAERALKNKARAEREAKKQAEEAKKQKERAKALRQAEGAKKTYPPAPFIKKCLHDFYTANAPEKLANLDKIIEKCLSSGIFPDSI
mmetsp:Transcript_7694/g.15057  ORF Transcript_7694/g.15057 Transcript_7694/m.15057 type:complete len:136 (-) Transcript_7694:501-908(-)